MAIASVSQRKIFEMFISIAILFLTVSLHLNGFWFLLTSNGLLDQLLDVQQHLAFHDEVNRFEQIAKSSISSLLKVRTRLVVSPG